MSSKEELTNEQKMEKVYREVFIDTILNHKEMQNHIEKTLSLNITDEEEIKGSLPDAYLMGYREATNFLLGKYVDLFDLKQCLIDDTIDKIDEYDTKDDKRKEMMEYSRNLRIIEKYFEKKHPLF